MHLSNIRDRIIALQKTHEQKQENESNRDQKQIYNIKTVGITKSQSADSILSMEVKDDRIKQDEGGRGWSQFIGDATAEPDVTDYNKGKYPTGSHLWPVIFHWLVVVLEGVF